MFHQGRLRRLASTDGLAADPIHDTARGLTAVLGRGRIGRQCGVTALPRAFRTIDNFAAMELLVPVALCTSAS